MLARLEVDRVVGYATAAPYGCRAAEAATPKVVRRRMRAVAAPFVRILRYRPRARHLPGLEQERLNAERIQLAGQRDSGRPRADDAHRGAQRVAHEIDLARVVDHRSQAASASR